MKSTIDKISLSFTTIDPQTPTARGQWVLISNIYNPVGTAASVDYVLVGVPGGTLYKMRVGDTRQFDESFTQLVVKLPTPPTSQKVNVDLFAGSGVPPTLGRVRVLPVETFNVGLGSFTKAFGQVVNVANVSITNTDGKTGESYTAKQKSVTISASGANQIDSVAVLDGSGNLMRLIAPGETAVIETADAISIKTINANPATYVVSQQFYWI